MIETKQIGVSRFLIKGDDLDQYEDVLACPGVNPIIGIGTEVGSIEVHRSHLPLLNAWGIPQPGHIVSPPVNGRVTHNSPYPPRDYQQEAMDFISERTGTILASDLGLGKTGTSLGALVNPGVVVCPTSALQVWQDEAELFGLDVQVLQGVKDVHVGRLSRDVGLYIVTYGSMETWLPYFRPEARGPTIYSMVADEAHYLHKKWSRWSSMFKAVPRDQTQVLTATPMRNRLRSLHGLLDAVAPGAFGSAGRFRVRHCGAFLNEYGLEDGPYLTNTNELAQRLGEVMIRETWMSPRVQHLRPPLKRQLVPVDISLEERSDLVRRVLSSLQGIQPYSGGHLKFTTKQRVEVGKIKSKWLTSTNKLSEIVERHGRVIVWTWHKQTAREIAQWAEENLGIPVDLVTGDSPTKKRNKLLREWQHGDPNEPRLVVATEGALSTAVNLTTAQAAVFVEYSFAPIDLQQAEARHHRPGSKFDEVWAYYLFLNGTIDQRLSQVLLEKIQQSQEVLGEESQMDQMLTLIGGER